MCEPQRLHPWVALGLIAAVLPLTACQRAGAVPDEAKVPPATVERIKDKDAKDTEISRLTLTEKAADRLDIKTAAVSEEPKERAGKTSLRKVVPYSAVLYDATGAAWVYTNPSGLVFVRARITVDYIERDVAMLSDGPAVGVKVVTQGASLLYGTEFGVGEG